MINKTIYWDKNENASVMINQIKIPFEKENFIARNSEDIYQAIKTMIVRGAPAIGIAGAHGVALCAIEEKDNSDFLSNIKKKAQYINSSRPTAVNLSWAINEQLSVLDKNKDKTQDEIIEILIENAIKMEDDDIRINKKIGEYGAQLVPDNARILTHCNAGRLATVGWGTALGVIRSAKEQGKNIKVYADETRPRAQGARLTTYELYEDGIDVTLITDGMGAYCMAHNMIDMVITGADRIALNGDSANKIGTYMVALAAHYHNIPFYIAAPKSTIDPNIQSKDEIIIEMRDDEEVTTVNGKRICVEGIKTLNPSFDVTPNELITGIITEYGVFKPDEIYKLFE